MEQGVKLKLGLALVLTQLLIYYYLPKGGFKEKIYSLRESQGDFCRVSPVEKVCLTPFTALMQLCPQPKVNFTPRIKESKKEQSTVDDDDYENGAIAVQTYKNQKKTENENRGKIKKEKKENSENEDEEMLTANEENNSSKEENKESSLSYHIIVVLLIVSVGASLADCFHERSKRRANPELANATGARGEPSLNRRMSLADLTMQRHARRESQASFRPPSAGSISKQAVGQERFTDRRSSSQENPRGSCVHAQAPSRQKSCPVPFLRRLSTIDLQDARDPQDGSWAERRRVRMIQRH